MAEISGTPHEIAYRLLVLIGSAENMDLGMGRGSTKPTREWIIRTYGQCASIVKEPERGEHWVEEYKP